MYLRKGAFGMILGQYAPHPFTGSKAPLMGNALGPGPWMSQILRR